MTWQRPLMTLAVAALSAAALPLASQVRAEGGDGSGIILPHEFEKLQADAASEATAAEVKADVEGVIEQTSALTAAQSLARARGRSGDAARAETIRPLIARHASENAIPFELADAIVRLESRYNAGARSGPNLGLTQVNLQTARSLGYKGDPGGLLDPETNLRYGLKYLARAYRLADGDTCGTVLRYQFGHRTQTMTKASQAYCAKVKTITASAD